MLFSLGRRHVSDRLKEAAVVEPVDPFERGGFNCFQRAPWPTTANDLGLEQAIDGFCQRIVVAIANATDRRVYTCFRKAFRIVNGDVLHAPVAMVHQSTASDGPAVMQCLLQG